MWFRYHRVRGRAAVRKRVTDYRTEWYCAYLEYAHTFSRLRLGKRLRNEPLTESEELELVSSSVAENRRRIGPIVSHLRSSLSFQIQCH